MSELIQWARAKWWEKQWNPVIGCKPCSPACEHCYAAAWAKRFGQLFEPHESSQTRPPRKGIVFCGNITDLFGEWMWPHKGSYIMKSPADLIAKCDSCDATYLWLTKRVDRLTLELSVGEIPRMNEEGIVECVRLSKFAFPNHYFGFTAENQEWYDRRVMRMNHWPKWANAWVSCEPLLGPIDLDAMAEPKYKWVVVGCESGPNRRPCKSEWVESIVEQCLAANVPVFVKQICLPNGKFTNKIEEFPKHLQIRQVPWAQEGKEK